MSDSQEEAVRAFALGLPGAWEDPLPGRISFKVGNKVFVFLGAPVGGMGVKLPESGGVLLTMSFARPYGYGLGKSGWVEITLGDGDGASADLLLKCVAESYRAVAPKTLVAQIDAGGEIETGDALPDDPSAAVEVERVPAPQNKGQRAAVLHAPQPTRREGPKRGLPAIPTMFNGRQYRSRLEARWAAFMLLCGWKHEYEYLDLNGWIPDFAVWGHHGNKVWVEVKPEESFPEDTAVKMEDGLPIKYRERGDELLILGTEPCPVPYAPANRGQPRLGWLGRYAPSPDQGEWVWEDCLFGRWTDDAPFGFCASSPPYHDRITGERSGGRLPGAEGDDLARLWAEAGNRVQWRSPRDDDG